MSKKLKPEKKLSLSFDEVEDVKAFIHNNESSLYGGVNVNGEDVVVLLEKGEGMEVITYQNNGWIRKNFYNHLGLADGETFEGRWKINGKEV
jgi:hypothetical protein